VDGRIRDACDVNRPSALDSENSELREHVVFVIRSSPPVAALLINVGLISACYSPLCALIQCCHCIKM